MQDFSEKYKIILTYYKRNVSLYVTVLITRKLLNRFTGFIFNS